MACPVHCHLCRSPWGSQSHKSNALQVDDNSPAHSASTAAVTTCTTKLIQGITYLSHPIGTDWQPNTVHSYMGIRHINWTSARFKSMLNLLVSWECPDGPSSSPMDPENPGYKIKTIYVVFLKTLFVCHRTGTYPYSLVGVCLMKLNRVGADGSLSSQRSDSVVQSGVKGDNWPRWWLTKVIFDKGNHELYLLVTLEHSGLLYFPYGATTRSAIAAPLSSTAPIDRQMMPVLISVIISLIIVDSLICWPYIAVTATRDPRPGKRHCI